jgi:hypothetical protein
MGVEERLYEQRSEAKHAFERYSRRWYPIPCSWGPVDGTCNRISFMRGMAAGASKTFQFAPSVCARLTIDDPTWLPSVRPWLTSKLVWIRASNVEFPASEAMEVKACWSAGKR